MNFLLPMPEMAEGYTMKCTQFQPEQIPPELTTHPQWVGFNVTVGSKTPVIADSPQRKASCTNPSTWRPFNVAVEGLKRNHYNAVAYALADDFVAVDLDDCFEGGELSASAREVVERLDTYVERSVSGKGLHALLSGKLPGRGRKIGGRELYSNKRFIICTGAHEAGTPTAIRPATSELLDWLLAEHSTEGSKAHMASVGCVGSIGSVGCVGSLGSVTVAPACQTLAADAVVRMTLPTRHGERNRCILRLARGLRFDAGLKDSAIRDLRPIVRQWHVAALPFINTRDFDETWSDFIRAWERAQLPLSGGIDTAWKAAIAAPMPAEAADYDNPLVRQLVALCKALSATSPHGGSFLSTHGAATLLNVQPMQVFRWLRMMQADGHIELVSKGDYGVRRASRYRWTGATA